MTDLVLASDGDGSDGRISRALARTAEQLRQGLVTFVEDGLGPVTGSAAYAADRLERVGDIEKAIQRVVRETVASSGASGFVTGLGGFATMPISVPANLAGAAMLNARMVGAIAHLRGYDLRDPVVQQLLLLVVAGESANAAMRNVGIRIGQKLATRGVERVSVETIRRINARVGITLLAKYGTKRSAITLVKLVPFVGGVVGGTVDATFTKAVATAAKRAFPADND